MHRRLDLRIELRETEDPAASFEYRNWIVPFVRGMAFLDKAIDIVSHKSLSTHLNRIAVLGRLLPHVDELHPFNGLGDAGSVEYL